jgi:peptidoglycan/LPS O-acetylase OafA/YrhL
MASRIDNLQAIRGFSCLLIAVAHAFSWESRFGLSVFPSRVMGFVGHIPIDLLFVTSGFILTYAHFGPGKRSGGIGTYLWRRAWRVFPTYWTALALAVASYTLVFGYPLPAPGWGYVWDMAWLRPRIEHPHVLPVAWTMVYEVLFYGVFGLALIVPRWASLTGVGVWAAITIGLAVAAVEPQNTTLRHLLSPFMLELLAGCLVAWAVTRTRVFPSTALGIGLVWMVGGVALACYRYPILMAMTSYRVVLMGVPAALLVYGTTTAERFGWRAPQWLCRVGDKSYSIYLVHWIAQSVVFYVTLWMNMSHSKTWHVVWLGMMIVAGIGSGLVFYQLVEKPVMSVVRNKRPKNAAGVPEDSEAVATPASIPISVPGRQAA